MRKQGWEKRLSDFLSAEREAPFVWGKNDCIAFAAKAANEVVERDLMPEFDSYGAYDEKAAQEMLAKFDGDLCRFFDAHFRRRYNLNFIQRGDIVVIEFRGVRAAGVLDCSGRVIACKTLAGLLHVPLDKNKIVGAWDIDERAE